MTRTIYYTIDGWVCERYPYDLNRDIAVGMIEVDDEVFKSTLYSDSYHAWRVKDGQLVNEQYEVKQWTIEERIAERTLLHQATDGDYAKYARNVRLNIDLDYSQSCCDYIDQYNEAISNTASAEGYPQTVSYPTYMLPSKS